MTLRYFRMEEFKCKGENCCGGANLMNSQFLQEIDDLRHEYGKPLTVTSAYRCPIHNARVSSTGANGPHTTGRAVDFGVDRGDAYRLAQLAFKRGFTGIGFQQKGTGRFLHVDNLPNTPASPRPTVWSY